jgi:hypothetical protein
MTIDRQRLMYIRSSKQATIGAVKNAVFWDILLTKYLHVATSQKTTFFMVTAVKTSNLTIGAVLSVGHATASYQVIQQF